MKQWIDTSKKAAVINRLSEIKTAESCDSAGGELRQVCMNGAQMCIVQYNDAGKPCISGVQCEGECRAPYNHQGSMFTVGSCSTSNNPCGCWANVEFGLIQKRICRD